MTLETLLREAYDLGAARVGMEVAMYGMDWEAFAIGADHPRRRYEGKSQEEAVAKLVDAMRAGYSVAPPVKSS